MDYRRINWIASFPKSGSTWTRCFMDAYFLGHVDINSLLTTFGDDIANLHAIGDGSKANDQPVDIQQMLRPMALVRFVRQANESPVPLMLKTHSAHMLTNGIELLPEGLTKSTIHIVRDPRDVLPSYANHMGVDVDMGWKWMTDKYRTLTGMKGKMSDFISSWHMHTQSYMNADTHNVLTIRFEDLKDDPKEGFYMMLRHMGLDVDPIRLKNAVELTNLARLKEQEIKKGFHEKSHKAGEHFFGGKREKLTDVQRFRVEKKFGGMMKRLGYLQVKAA